MSDSFERSIVKWANFSKRQWLSTSCQWNGREDGPDSDQVYQVVCRRRRDWDEYEERLKFSINTAQNRMRKETPFYSVHVWDARSTIEATLSIVNGRRPTSGTREWGYRIQSQYQ